MTSREHPTVLEHLAIGGLRPEILQQFRGRHRTGKPCVCLACDSNGFFTQDENPHAGVFTDKWSPTTPWKAGD